MTESFEHVELELKQQKRGYKHQLILNTNTVDETFNPIVSGHKYDTIILY